MSFDTGNIVPSSDPRDLYDNSENLDSALHSSASTWLDRLGTLRKTWAQIETDAAALVSPNVSSLAGLSLSADRLLFSTGAGTLNTSGLTLAARQLLDDVDASAMRTTLGAAPLASPQFTGNPTAPTTATTENSTSLATTAFVKAVVAALVNGAPGTLDQLNELAAALGNDPNYATTITNLLAAKAPLASPSLTGTPTAPTPTVGTNTTQIATAAQIQAEIANKRAWVGYTPVVTASAGTFGATSSNGKYLSVFGVCFFQVTITVSSLGDGVGLVFTLPGPALAGSANMIVPARESVSNGKLGCARILANLTQARCVDYANGDLVTAAGSTINVSGSYPLA